MLDVVFLPEGGVQSITQTGAFTYVDGTQKAWAQRGEYTAADQMLVLNGSPRVVDGGMTTTAQTIRMNRATGDAFADGNVKSTYSDLKAQPDGAMLASSDPIHVISRSMTAHRSSAIAVYTGDARLWQDANIVEAPTCNLIATIARSLPRGPLKKAHDSTSFDRARPGGQGREGDSGPHHLGAPELCRRGAEGFLRWRSDRQIRRCDHDGRADDGVSAAAEPVTTPRREARRHRNESPGKIDRIIAEERRRGDEPTRHATGDRLVYTSADDKFVLTGGPPSIFDAERGKITGDSLTFYRHDDRVLVEGRKRPRRSPGRKWHDKCIRWPPTKLANPIVAGAL